MIDIYSTKKIKIETGETKEVVVRLDVPPTSEDYYIKEIGILKIDKNCTQQGTQIECTGDLTVLPNKSIKEDRSISANIENIEIIKKNVEQTSEMLIADQRGVSAINFQYLALGIIVFVAAILIYRKIEQKKISKTHEEKAKALNNIKIEVSKIQKKDDVDAVILSVKKYLDEERYRDFMKELSLATSNSIYKMELVGQEIDIIRNKLKILLGNF